MYRRATVIGIWLLIIAGAVYVFVFEPGRTGFFPECLFRNITGLDCPGCGMTRALHEIVHGNFLTAFTLNPLLLLALPFLFSALLRYSVTVFRGGILRAYTLPARYIYALFFLILSFWIFRNTPAYPWPLLVARS